MHAPHRARPHPVRRWHRDAPRAGAAAVGPPAPALRPMSGWTADEIPDQSGRTFVITGANSGIGFEAAKALAGHGAHVVLAVRDTGKGERAAAQIDGSTEVRRLDLADL